MFAGQASLPKSCSVVLQLPSMFDSAYPHRMNAKDILGFMGIKENGEKISIGRFKRKPQKGGHRQKICEFLHDCGKF